MKTKGFMRFDQIGLRPRERERDFTMNQDKYLEQKINGKEDLKLTLTLEKVVNKNSQDI